MSHIAKDDKFDVPQDSSSKAMARKKKPYSKPAFKWERVFETQALSCTKQTGNSGCQSTKKTS
jgi:hypothetical protein